MFRHFIRWLSRYQLVAVIELIALAIICFNGAAGLGLPALFWCRPSVIGLLSIGFTVALLFALCSFVGYLLDHNHAGVGLKAYITQTIWLPTLAVFLRGICFLFSKERCGREWVVLIGYAIGLAFVNFVGPLLARAANPLAANPRFIAFVNWLSGKRNTTAPGLFWLHALAVLVLLILGAIYMACAIGVEHAPINAAVAISMLLGLILLFYGAVRFFVPRAVLLVVAALVAWMAAVNQIPLKHRYQELEDVKTISLAEFRKAPQHDPDLLDDAALLNTWRAHIGGTAKPKLIVVMTSGGGIRASVWTAAVLQELQSGYGKNIRMITGASGGMVGAGFDVANRAFGDSRVAGQKLRAVTADALDRVARYLVLRDVPALFLPLRIRDRGYALEWAWKHNAPVMARTFRQLREIERTAVVPSLIYAPASLDDGRRLLVSNLRLDYMTVHGLDGMLLSTSALQFFDLYRHDLSIATGARMSASFPWVSSATELPTFELRRIGDAGYFDNYGGFVTAAWLLHNRDWLLANTSGVLVLQVRDSPFGADNRNIAAVPDGLPIATRAFSELTAPIAGALQTRSGVMYFRNDSDLAVAGMLFGKGFLRTVEIELPHHVAPLSWNLTDAAAQKIIAAAPVEVRRKMKTIEPWWTAASPAAR